MAPALSPPRAKPHVGMEEPHLIFSPLRRLRVRTKWIPTVESDSSILTVVFWLTVWSLTEVKNSSSSVYQTALQSTES
jgi:hypothetical protein